MKKIIAALLPFMLFAVPAAAGQKGPQINKDCHRKNGVIFLWVPSVGFDCLNIPDSRLTPGAVASTNRVKVCGRNAAGLTYSEAHRHTTEEMKFHVAAMYGIRDRREYEFDHLVPLELGGADTVENIWPQPWAEAREKDRIEDQMARNVCVGRINLDGAQKYFLNGWWEEDVK